MSTYVSVVSDVGSITIRAGIHEVRLVQIITTSVNLDLRQLKVAHFSAATFSDGTTLAVTPLRRNAPPASATVRSGATMPTSTQKTIQYYNVPAGGETVLIPGASELNYNYWGTTVPFQPPLAVTVLPGCMLRLSGSDNDMINSIYFEELRLSGSV